MEFRAHDSELSVLKVDDPAFFKGTEPLALGGLPRQRDRVFAYGFPVGGEDLSVTERVNGRAVADMELLLRALSRLQGRFLVVETDGLSSPGGLIVLNAGKAEQANADILKTYGIEADRSEYLR